LHSQRFFRPRLEIPLCHLLPGFPLDLRRAFPLYQRPALPLDLRRALPHDRRRAQPSLLALRA